MAQEIKMRLYQSACRRALYNWFESETGNPLVVMATGTGKSVCIADFVRDVQQSWPDQRIVVAVDVKELIAQNYLKLLQMWPDASAGIYSAGLGKKQLHQKTLFVGIQSVYNKAYAIQRCDLLLIDEAHMIPEDEQSMWRQFINELLEINPDMKIIGFTATEYRMGTGLLHTGEKRMFDGICYRYGIKEALDDGWLVEIIPKNMTTKVDMTGVKKRGGDYIESEQGKRWNIDEITKSAVAEILEYGEHRKSGLLFSSGVEHAYAICEELKANGQTAAVVTGETPDAERDQILTDFKALKIKYVVNNAVLTKGFDHPFLDMIAVLRKTLSPVLWLQILGRGTRATIDLNPYETAEERIEAIRASEKPDCLLLDFGGNTRHFGPMDKIIFKDKGESDGLGVPPMKDCPQCNTLIFAGCRVCPAPVMFGASYGVRDEDGHMICGFEFPEPERKIEATASTAPVVSSQSFKEEKIVREVRYDFHEGKNGKKPTLKVTYKIDLKESFSEWICLEHEGFPREKAARWWRERFDYDRFPDMQQVPRSVDEALGMKYALAVPSKIWVMADGKFHKITNYDFSAAPPTAELPPAAYQQPEDGCDDLIPF